MNKPATGVYNKVIVRCGRLAGVILRSNASDGPRLLEALHGNDALSGRRADLLFYGPMGKNKGIRGREARAHTSSVHDHPYDSSSRAASLAPIPFIEPGLLQFLRMGRSRPLLNGHMAP
ncbi:MAG TPA: hypothetical protein VFY29_21470 [Terriglobia bacterium]|nr:hypothetical protein [Terriglobia bacterium]